MACLKSLKMGSYCTVVLLDTLAPLQRADTTVLFAAVGRAAAFLLRDFLIILRTLAPSSQLASEEGLSPASFQGTAQSSTVSVTYIIKCNK